jgi:hypothetical protein
VAFDFGTASTLQVVSVDAAASGAAVPVALEADACSTTFASDVGDAWSGPLAEALAAAHARSNVSVTCRICDRL